MNNKHLILATLRIILCLFPTHSAFADSWLLTQSVRVTTPLALYQNATADGSIQAVNGINTDTISAGSTQNLDIGSNTLLLRQKAGAESSTQAINWMQAQMIEGARQDITVIGNLRSVELDQTGTIGDSNTQAINAAFTPVDGSIQQLSQEVSTTAISLSMLQAGGAHNLQSANLIESGQLSAAGSDVIQAINIGVANIQQDSTSDSIQAANALITLEDGSGGAIRQEFSGIILNPLSFLSQNNVDSSSQALNYAGERL